ncbi:MAG TPA: cytochrome c oxidase accessory protein CcoG [Noviherbaspirillum sp.]|nr:cytochrome c oxidase accessory protein CcoG [Noviherbaspirillum sp.]
MGDPAPKVQIIRMYEARQEIYPREVKGRYANLRWFFVWLTQAIFYGLPWLAWNDRQAVLFDLGARKFYIFGLVLWPQDFIYLALLLIISAYALFLFTAVFGRVWCGFSCPQTVYTEIFMWVERRIEGDRSARMRLDRQPWNAQKIARKSAKHFVWGAIALWTGFTFVGYFSPIRELGQSVVSLGLGPWETFWILFYGFATYGNAGWMREQVCKYMCPYARFQSAMFDRDTLIVSYDATRGEPRGARAKSKAAQASSLGDCIDCSMCVQVCPVGIDIRDGLQYDCISCAGCVDACNNVMDKIGAPRGLIRFSTDNALRQRFSLREIVRRTLRPRVLVYSTILVLIVAAFSASLYWRTPVKLDVIRDRGVMAREVEDGLIENVYRLQVMNTTERSQRLRITVTGIDGIRLDTPDLIEVEGTTTQAVPVRVRIDPAAGERGSNTIFFELQSRDEAWLHVKEKAAFIVPR